MTVTSSGVPSWRSHDRRLDELGRQRDVDQVAGDRDVVGRLGAQVLHQRVEHLAPVHPVAAPLPGEVAQHALVHQRARG